LGALGSLLFVQVLPWGFGLMHGAQLTITFSRVLGFMIVLFSFMALGGLVACLVGDATDARHALFYGLGWQGLIGGFIQGKRAEQALASGP
jgi:hypothetical protein